MKTFIENYKIARVLAKKVLRKGGYIKYSLYYMMKLIFSIGVFLSPFLVSKWKIASQIKEDNKISLTGLYEPVSGKGYFNLLVANLIKAAMFIGALLVIALCGGILFWFGYGIGIMNENMLRNFKIFPFLFIIPAALALIALIISLPFINVPNSYIINSYPLLSPGKVLKYSFYSLKNGGKLLMFKTLLFKYLILLLYLGIGFIVSVLPYIFIKNNVGIGLMIVLITIFSIGFLLLLPFIGLITLIIESNIYDEVVFVKNSNNLTEINIKSNEITIGSSNSETLSSLFMVENKKVETTSYQNSLDENTRKNKVEEALKKKELKEATLEAEQLDSESELETSENDSIEEKNISTNEEVLTSADGNEENIEPNLEKELATESIEELALNSEDDVIGNVDEENKTVAEEEVSEAIGTDESNIESNEATLNENDLDDNTPQSEDIEEVLESNPEEEVPVDKPVVEEVPAEEEEEIAQEEAEPEVEETLEPQEEPVEESQEEIVETEELAPEETTEDEVLEEVLEPQEEGLSEKVEEETIEEVTVEEAPEEEMVEETDEELEEILKSIPEKKVEENKELDEILASIPEKEKKDDELDEVLASIPEKKTRAKKASSKTTEKAETKTTKKTTKKKGE